MYFNSRFKVSLLTSLILFSGSNSAYSMDFYDYIPVVGGVKNKFLEGNSSRRSLAKRVTRFIMVVTGYNLPAIRTARLVAVAYQVPVGPLRTTMLFSLQKDFDKLASWNAVEESIHDFLESQNDEFVNQAGNGMDAFLGGCGGVAGGACGGGIGAVVGGVGGFLF